MYFVRGWYEKQVRISSTFADRLNVATTSVISKGFLLYMFTIKIIGPMTGRYSRLWHTTSRQPYARVRDEKFGY
jgi:hypothetical protein